MHIYVQDKQLLIITLHCLRYNRYFYKMVEGSIINYDTVLLNMAISPRLWLIPSNLIAGYNNRLGEANSVMKFGRNISAHNQPKKVHLETLEQTEPKDPTTH